MVDNPAYRSAAITGVRLQVSNAKPVCDRQASSRDTGIRSACDYVGLWNSTLTTLSAADTIRQLGSKPADPANPGAPRTASASVPDEAWSKVGDQMALARKEMATWSKLPDRPEVREHTIGVSCQLFSAMVAADTWPTTSFEAKKRALTDVRSSTLKEIAAATRLLPSCTDPASSTCDAAITEVPLKCVSRR